jgi:myo-inositol-1(or 4)-monophosphatase
MTRELELRIRTARRLVRAQAGRLHRDFRRARTTWKHDGTRVTAADLAISAALVRALRARFPTDQVFSEEAGTPGQPVAATARFCWVLDPIDGTNNYATGIPFCAISLALLEQGRPVYGVVYDMARRTLIHGGPGAGAFDGRRPARARRDPPRADSLVGLHSPVDRHLLPQLAPVIARFKIRGLGSSTLHLAYVGIGLLDGVVDTNVRVWDIAAADAIARGGGAEIHYLRNNPFPLREFDLAAARIRYVAGNRAMCSDLRALLRM